MRARSLVLSVCLASPALAQSVVLRELHRSVPVEHGSSVSIATADLNGDGFGDVVVGNLNAPLDLLLGDGDGLVDAASQVPALSFQARDLALGDVDGDGDLDLFIGTSFSANRLFENLGNATFVDSSGQVPAIVDSTVAVALGDVDGDGDIDAMTFNSSSTESDRLFVNDGTGNFANAPFPFGQSAILDAELVDVDGDNDLDLLGTNRLYANDGTGTFTDVSAQLIPAPLANTFGIAVADLDGDGDLDFALASLDTFNRAYAGDGSGTFVQLATAIPPIADASFDVDAGDVDGDGDVDLFFVSSNGDPSRLVLNDGTAAFVDVGATQLPARTDSSRAVALFDVEGDGDLDAFLANETFEQNRLYKNDGAGTFVDVTKHPAHAVFESSGPTVSFAIGDVDGDGDADVLEADLFPLAARLLLGDGAGGFADASANLPATSNIPAADIALADLDGDGDLDAFLVGTSPQPFSQVHALLWRNGGTGVFVDATAGLPPSNVPGRAVALGDVDGDGDLDALIARSGSPTAPSLDRLLLNDGSATFTDAPALLPPIATQTTDVELVDVDLDGDLDAVLASGEACSFGCGVPFGTQNRVYRNDGLAGFVDATAQVPAILDRTVAVAVGDVDVDGFADLYFVNTGSEQDRFWRNFGGGVFVDATNELPPLPSWGVDAAFGDIDLDGDLDLLLGTPGGSGLRYLRRDPTAFALDNAALEQTPDDQAFSVALADLDRDGDLDLLVGALRENRLYSNVLRHVSVTTVPAIGKPLTLAVSGAPANPWTVFVSTGTASIPTSFGVILIDLATLQYLDGGALDANGEAVRTYPIANNPALVGASAHLQALVNLPLQLTNRETVTFTSL